MFGIILANTEALDQSEKDRYEQVYCGVCHSLKSRYGQISRLCANFDMAFAALLLESLHERGETLHTARCAAKPLEAHRYAQGPFIDFAADMSLALAYHKCLDNWFDERSAASFAGSKALQSAYGKVEAAYPGICNALEENLARIRELEGESLRAAAANGEEARAENLVRADAIARSFGDVMAEIFAFHALRWEGTVGTLGFNLGRFVYFMDAAIDRDADLHNGSYNPFNVCESAEDSVEFILNDTIGQAAAAFERLPLERDLHLLRSVLYSGVWAKRAAHDEEKASKEKHGEESL